MSTFVDEREYAQTMFLLGAWHGMASKYKQRAVANGAIMTPEENKLYEEIQAMTFKVLNGEPETKVEKKK